MSDKINIAIVDSGINREYFPDTSVFGTAFHIVGNEIINNNDINDVNGHGTSCAYIIKKYIHNVNFIIVKILDCNNFSHPALLVNALEYLGTTEADIINLSLSITNSQYYNDIQEQINILNKKNKIIIVSVDNEEKKTNILTKMKYVISVGGAPFVSEEFFWFNKNKKINCISSNIPVLVPSKNNYQIFSGTSKASAVFSGILGKYWEQNNGDKEKLIYEIEKNSFRSDWDDKDLIDLSRQSRKYIYDIIESNKSCIISDEMIRILSKYINIQSINMLKQKSLFEIGINKSNCINLMLDIEKNLNITIDYSKVNYFSFSSIYSLMKLINK